MPGAVCVAPDTPIATPSGSVPIARFRPGDLVYGVDRGVMVTVPVLRARSTPVFGHHVLHLELDNGQTFDISGGHPTAEGGSFRDLIVGQRVGGASVRTIADIPYQYPRTYDIQPASDTGTYVAAGILIGSTWGAAPRP